LVPGDDFRVLDSNACDDGGDAPGAVLQLAVNENETVYYDLWIRLVGPPDSGIDVQICATDPADYDYVVCETDNYVKVRDSDRPTFTNATSKLLRFQGDPLFSSDYENYFWGWNTTGKPHAQLWFVESGAGL